MERPSCLQGDALFGPEVRLREVPQHGGFLAVVVVVVGLSEGEMDGGGAAAKFEVADGEARGADGGAAEEGQVQGDGVRLVAGGVGGGEMERRGGEEARGYETAVRDCLSLQGFRSVIADARWICWGADEPLPIDHSSGK